MTNSNEQIRAELELFNEKANKLLSLSFTHALLDPKRGVKIGGKRKDDCSFELRTELRGPSQESIDAFVLTFRFFIQDNEPISLRNMSETYNNAEIDPKFIDRFDSARNATNDLLDSPNQLNIQFNDSTPTNRDVMEVFIYGGLAHANPKKIETFRQWMSFPPVAALFRACFVSVLGDILSAIDFIAKLNEEVLAAFPKS